MPAKAGFQ